MRGGYTVCVEELCSVADDFGEGLFADLLTCNQLQKKRWPHDHRVVGDSEWAKLLFKVAATLTHEASGPDC